MQKQSGLQGFCFFKNAVFGLALSNGHVYLDLIMYFLLLNIVLWNKFQRMIEVTFKIIVFFLLPSIIISMLSLFSQSPLLTSFPEILGTQSIK